MRSRGMVSWPTVSGPHEFSVSRVYVHTYVSKKDRLPLPIGDPRPTRKVAQVFRLPLEFVIIGKFGGFGSPSEQISVWPPGDPANAAPARANRIKRGSALVSIAMSNFSYAIPSFEALWDLEMLDFDIGYFESNKLARNSRVIFLEHLIVIYIYILFR